MEPEWIFFDGSCGFCHRWVRFVLARDRDGRAFRFSPRTGETFQTLIPASARAVLPPSIVVLTGNGRVLTRSAATLHILKRLGGVWSFLAAAGNFVPRAARDFVYSIVARVRHRLYAAPEGLCPVVAPELRKRFAP
ncbi:MAG: DCC1-like thiol-disulfide oxidoreductase family protein [Acidobacteriota bacterium]|nr:DCC1-like thiol-disulfide oxidoreductase family protein [Acidobacteriota bacterium]